MLSFLRRRQRRPRIASAADLVDYCDRQAAYVTQRVIYEYTRARSGLLWSKLMLERDFVAALSAARWPAYDAVLDDLAVMLEIRLRDETVPPERRVEGLLGLRAAVRARHPELLGEGESSALRARLLTAAAAPPVTAQHIAKTSGARLYAVLPLAAEVTKYDRELVTNAVRFLFARLAEDLDLSLDAAAARATLLDFLPKP